MSRKREAEADSGVRASGTDDKLSITATDSLKSGSDKDSLKSVSDTDSLKSGSIPDARISGSGSNMRETNALSGARETNMIADLTPPSARGHLRRSHRLNQRLRLKRKKQYIISIHGDSISKGIVWDDESGRYKTLPDNYAVLVGQRLKGNVFNRARFGMTLGRAMSRSIKDLDDLKPEEKPDVVLIEYGGNDCDFDWDAIGREPEGVHGPKTELEVFRSLLRSLIVRFSANRILPVVMTLPPLDADRYFNWVSKSSPQAAENILKWLGSTSRIYWWQERYNAAVLEVAAETGAHVLDVRSAFLHEPDYRAFLCADGIHPNGAGHALMAERVGEWLERFCARMLREARTKTA